MNATPDPNDFATGGAVVPATAEIERIVEDRDEALALMRLAGEALIAARQQVLDAAAVGSRAARGSRFYGHGDAAPLKLLFPDAVKDLDASVEAYRKDLDASIWYGLVERMNIRQMMDRTEAEAFDRSLKEEVPEVTVDNVMATLERLVGEAGLIFARGLARAFIELDERFKSHDAFKLGSRMILTYVFDDWGHFRWGRQRDTIADVERVFATLDGEAPDGGGLCHEIEASRGRGMEPRQSTTESRYFRVKGYMNGNAHLWFTRPDLVEKANRVLAAYYGEVLPDAVEPEEGGKADLFRTGRAVSRDLQFYPTPDAAADELFHELPIGSGMRVLEPSAGEGGIARALARHLGNRYSTAHEHWRSYGQRRGEPEPKPDTVDLTAVEVHPDRCDVLRRVTGAWGRHLPTTVVEANFLEWPPVDGRLFDLVLMNPPFYGTHWMKHVQHAYDHLAPGGILRAILPVTARIGESKDHLAFRRWAEMRRRSSWRQWRDLPAESFAASGTRINTTILELVKR